MKVKLNLYARGGSSHFLRSQRIKGTKAGFYQLYKVTCCQVMELMVSTLPPSDKIELTIMNVRDLGDSPECHYHCFTDLVVVHPLTLNINKPLIQKRSVLLSGECGVFRVPLVLHRPMVCPCHAWIRFSIRNGAYLTHYLFQILPKNER